MLRPAERSRNSYAHLAAWNTIVDSRATVEAYYALGRRYAVSRDLTCCLFPLCWPTRAAAAGPRPADPVPVTWWSWIKSLRELRSVYAKSGRVRLVDERRDSRAKQLPVRMTQYSIHSEPDRACRERIDMMKTRIYHKHSEQADFLAWD